MRRRQFVSGAAALAATPAIALTGRPAHASVQQAGGSPLAGIGELLAGLIPELARQLGSPGYVAGIYQDGSEWMYAHGVRNLNTGDAMTTDTAWLLGSITKVATTTLLLKYVEAGRIDLDAPITRYLPDFRLAEKGAAQRIRVRQLVNHSNGIDADSLTPAREFGPNAVQSYIDALAGIGTLFAPAELLHYSNPGFTIAGRIVETLSGKSFNQTLEEEIFAPIGMDRSVTSATQAILHRTALGAYPGAGGEMEAAGLFMLPVSAAPAGATPIVTVGDLIAFARTHLADGLAPNGKRLLSAELCRAMRTPTFDLKTPNAPPVGLGWLLPPIGGTTAWWHGGGSPGGTASLTVFPEYDLVIASFGTGPGSSPMHDRLVTTVLREHLGLTVLPPFSEAATTLPMSHYEGDYEAFESRLEVRAGNGADELEVTSHYRPSSEEQERVLKLYTGSASGAATTTLTYSAIHDNLFAPAGLAVDQFAGVLGRLALLSFHEVGGNGGRRFAHTRLRALLKV